MDSTKLVRAARRLMAELGLENLFGLGAGLVAKTDTTTGYAARTLTGPAAGITVSNGNGASGNPTLALADDLAAVEALATTGIAARTAASTWATRTIVPPAAGIGMTNGDGVSGNPTLSLSNDLAALEGLSTTGVIVRTATDTMLTFQPACVTLSAAAEAGEARVVTLNLVDNFGTAINRAQRFRATLLDADGLLAVSTAWTITVGGGGVAISANTKATVIFDTNATGDATLTVTDVTTGQATTMYLLVEPLTNGSTFDSGFPAVLAVAFAA